MLPSFSCMNKDMNMTHICTAESVVFQCYPSFKETNLCGSTHIICFTLAKKYCFFPWHIDVYCHFKILSRKGSRKLSPCTINDRLTLKPLKDTRYLAFSDFNNLWINDPEQAYISKIIILDMYGCWRSVPQRVLKLLDKHGRSRIIR